jgi:hypothetical protein
MEYIYSGLLVLLWIVTFLCLEFRIFPALRIRRLLPATMLLLTTIATFIIAYITWAAVNTLSRM